MNRQGKYIVVEGPEGVGKTTQIELLARQLQSQGFAVRLFREPDSQSDLTARAIRTLTQDPRYPMNTRTEVLLYNAARSQSLEVIRQAVQNGVFCLVDRNYLTTLAIQYYGRGDVPDYQAINYIINFAVGDMQPDITVILDAPANVLKERSNRRDAGERFDNLGVDFLERVRAGYLWEARQRGYPVIHAVGDSAQVFQQVWQVVAPDINKPASPKRSFVPVDATQAAQSSQPAASQPLESSQAPPQSAPAPKAASAEAPVAKTAPAPAKSKQPLIQKKDQGGFAITDAGREILSEIVTNVSGDVYSFTENISPVTIAAAMARLSRRGDDLRITLLDEFIGSQGKDEKLLQRVITAYGDDSVQQLAGIHMVVENASNLLTKKLEWGRLAAYLEQSTRYIYFDQKDTDGKFRYYTPEYLEAPLKQQYNQTMDKIFGLYSRMVRDLTQHIRHNSDTPARERDAAWKAATRAQACDAARPVLPVATKSTVGIYASGQALESLLSHLLSDELPEAHAVGRNMLTEARKIMPAFLERIDRPERGVAAMGYRAFTYQGVKSLARKYLPANHSQDTARAVTLTSYWPKNELELVPDMLYEHSHLSLQEIEQEVRSWPYERKLEVFRQYMGERFNRRHRPGRALEKAHYSWDLVCDYGIFRDLQRHRMVDDLEWQTLTPRFGYEVPALIEEASLSDTFEQCFDLSLQLHSRMEGANYHIEAQYATLLGHKMRWKLTYNAREAFHFHELRTAPQGHPGYRKLVKQMHDKLAEIHPLMAEHMIFVNKDEDPALTRLAAERYTQAKLKSLAATQTTDSTTSKRKPKT